MFALAFSRFSDALAPKTTPRTANAGPATKPPRTAVPPAIPSPPADKAPPPKNAKVAFVAAAPLKEAIAVPVDAVAKAPAAPYAPNAVSAPAIAPDAIPPANDDAIPCNSFKSENDFLSTTIFCNSFNPLDSLNST